MVPRRSKKLVRAGELKQGSFFIYFVYNMSEDNPQMLILDYAKFKKYKIPEIKWLIQPNKIMNENPELKPISLPK